MAFHHENHCLGTEVAKVSSISPVSTTRERFAFLDASLRAAPLASGQDLWSRLGSHEGYPRSVCTHLATKESPHAMLTCAGLLLDLGRRVLHAHPGCIHDVQVATTEPPLPRAAEGGGEGRSGTLASTFTFEETA